MRGSSIISAQRGGAVLGQAGRAAEQAEQLAAVAGAVALVQGSLPAGHAVHAVIAIGRRGAAEALPEALQAREQPSQRLPLERIAERIARPVAELQVALTTLELADQIAAAPGGRSPPAGPP